jgi:hypothetical protein
VTVTRVRRTFVATPARSASATWNAIVDVVAPEGVAARSELLTVAGVAASLIAADAWERTAAVVFGVGPQLRIYCLYGEDAIVGDDANEDGLSWSPTEGDWSMELPCPLEDLEWVQSALADLSDRIRAVGATATRMVAATEGAGSVPGIDAEGFLRG